MMNSIVASALLVLLSGSVSHAASETIDRQRCGPVAVQSVLRYYGIEAELSQITDQVFAGSADSTSSMASLSRVLNQYGIETVAVEVQPDSQFHWREPVIVHFPQSETFPDGHFGVVWPNEKGDRDENDILISLTSLAAHHVSRAKLARIQSPIILLTSERPIAIDELCVSNGYSQTPLWASLGSIVLLLLLRIIQPRSLK